MVSFKFLINTSARVKSPSSLVMEGVTLAAPAAPAAPAGNVTACPVAVGNLTCGLGNVVAAVGNCIVACTALPDDDDEDDDGVAICFVESRDLCKKKL